MGTKDLRVISTNIEQLKLTADECLQKAIGEFQNVLIIGYDKDGYLEARADKYLSRKDMLWMIEKFKLDDLFYEEIDEPGDDQNA